jgi:hypothetical protein
VVKSAFVVCFLLSWSFVVLAQETPTPLDTRTMAVSAGALATVRRVMQSAETVLRFHRWASQHKLSAEDWASADFAAYTAGVLRYESHDITVVESSAPWQGSPTHAWLLVRVTTVDGALWFPIEPSPPAGSTQLHLGRIPIVVDQGSDLWFEKEYSSFDRILDDSPNQFPVLSLRPMVPAPEAGEMTRILAPGAIDPDGEIVLYWWDFGDGTTDRTSTWHVRHAFPSAETYRVAVTAVDNRGGVAQSAVEVKVASSEPGEADCGCGQN